MDETLSIIAAWWGAAIASLALLWNIVIWIRSGPRVSVELTPDQGIIGDRSKNEEKTWVTCRVRNLGERQTTIENMLGLYFPNWWRRFFNKPTKAFVALNAGISKPLPFVLEPGRIWDGGFEQSEEIENLARSGHLMCSIVYANSKRPVRGRIQIRSVSTEETSGEG